MVSCTRRGKIIDRFVALKLLAPERVGDAKFAERFTRRRRRWLLQSPQYRHRLRLWQAGGSTFYSWSFVRIKLRQLLERGNSRRRSAGDRAANLQPAIRARTRYRPRDIKPENLLLAQRWAHENRRLRHRQDSRRDTAGSPFAPAVLTPKRGGSLCDCQHGPGTPGYMAPNKARNRKS